MEGEWRASKGRVEGEWRASGERLRGEGKVAVGGDGEERRGVVHGIEDWVYPGCG